MFKKINKEWLKDRWQTLSIIVALGAIIGITPQTLKKAAFNTNQQIQEAIVFRETLFAATRGNMLLIAEGKVNVNGIPVKVEIRKNLVTDAYWACVINGHTELYRAFWDAIDRDFLYVDALNKWVHVKELKIYRINNDGKGKSKLNSISILE